MGPAENLCLGCMENSVVDGVCTKCGYTKNAPYLPSYLAPGMILNERYVVGKLISYNGESATYLALDNVLGRKVWLKEYMPDTLCKRVKGSSIISVNQNNLAQYKTFMSEFTELNKTLAKMRTLSHINPALELFAENNTTYVVFECLEGMSLKQYLSENAGELSWDEIKTLFPAIFTTLSLVHNAGVIHRGISPDTIWHTSKGELKLIGFSITAERTANTELASELYAGYAAPEQYSSSNWQGTWTDVYAICAVLYRMLTGCMPIEAISRIGNDNLSEPAQMNKSVPPNVSKVIMNGLKLSGDMRIQTITELVTKLFEQPDYLEQGMSRTATIAIPKQGGGSNYAPAHPLEQRKSEKTSKSKNDKVKKLRVVTTVFVVTIVVLLIVIWVAWPWLSVGTGNNVSGVPQESETSTESVLETSTGPMNITTTTVTESSGGTYQVVDFVGKNFELVQTSQAYKDWLVFAPKFEFNDSYPYGQIFEQNIAAGEFVSANTSIELKVSNGPKLVAVPDYLGKDEKAYFSELDALNIKYTRETIPDVQFTNGYVVTASKREGEILNVENGDVLIVYICENTQSIVETPIV